MNRSPSSNCEKFDPMLDHPETTRATPSPGQSPQPPENGAAGPKLGLYSLVRSTWWLATGYPADRYARLLKESQ